MNSKLSAKQIIIYTVGVLIWIVYFIQSYKLYSEIPSFVTPGSSYIIQVLEFTNFRASELLYSLVFYFILIAIYSYLSINSYKRSLNKKNTLIRILLTYVLLFAVLLWITTIFLPVYIILTLLANIVIIASFNVSSIIFNPHIKFETDDIVFKSNSYDNESEAKNHLNTMLNDLNKKYPDKLQGTVFEDNQKFYFEIYALSKITLDSKGDLQHYEDF